MVEALYLNRIGPLERSALPNAIRTAPSSEHNLYWRWRWRWLVTSRQGH